MRNSTFEVAAAQVGNAVAYGAGTLNRAVRSPEVAGYVGYSAYHFQRLFHAMAGEPWAEFHRRLRLEQAATMIRNGERSGDVWHRCGFENQETFIRAFKSAYGCTPTAIRREQASHLLLPTPTGVHAFDAASVEKFAVLRRYGRAIDFEIREIAPMNLIGITHRGPIQFISNAWLELNEWAQARGIDLKDRLLVTFAEELNEETPPELQVAYVAIDDRGEEVLERHALGGGEFLWTRHVGSGHLLADFWLRAYGECIPESGRIIRQAAAFQIYPHGLFVENPDDFVTDIYIPIEPNWARNINRKSHFLD